MKSVTFDCADPPLLATFWAAALGSTVDEDSTVDRPWVEPASWGDPNLWLHRVAEGRTAKNRQHFDLRAVEVLDIEVERLVQLEASILRRDEDLVVMADPEDNEFCLER